jgi:hypothetical protein
LHDCCNLCAKWNCSLESIVEVGEASRSVSNSVSRIENSMEFRSADLAQLILMAMHDRLATQLVGVQDVDPSRVMKKKTKCICIVHIAPRSFCGDVRTWCFLAFSEKRHRLHSRSATQSERRSHGAEAKETEQS